MPAAVGCSCILTELVPNFTRHIAQRGGQQQPSARPGAAVTAWRIVYKACSLVAGGGRGQARQAANLFRCLEGWWWRAEGGVSSQLRYTANLDTATHSNTSFRLSLPAPQPQRHNITSKKCTETKLFLRNTRSILKDTHNFHLLNNFAYHTLLMWWKSGRSKPVSRYSAFLRSAVEVGVYQRQY